VGDIFIVHKIFMILFIFCLCNTNWEVTNIIDKKEKKGGILKWSRDFIFQNTLNSKGNT
jgi:hypothetical protein